MTPMQRRFQRLWFWTQDDAPVWVSAYLGTYAWRPWCWARGYHQPHHCDVYYEVCTWCLMTLWSKKRDGGSNPLLGVDRAPAGWRRMRAGELSGKAAETVHAWPPDGSCVTPCCGKELFELATDSRVTEDPSLVTCSGKETARDPS